MTDPAKLAAELRLFNHRQAADIIDSVAAYAAELAGHPNIDYQHIGAEIRELLSLAD